MSRNKEYSVKKVTVAVTSILISISAGSIGTAYAQDSDIKPAVEMKYNDTVGRLNKPTIEGMNLEGTRKSDKLNEVAPKTIEKSVEKPTEKTAELEKDDKIDGEIVGEKIDWNSIDGREFLNHIISEAKADKNKEHEIKVLWLAKIKDLLTIYPNNENFQKIKTILEEDLRKDSEKEERPSDEKKENKEVTKETDNKETPKENKVSEDKKEKNKSLKKDEKDTPKGQTVPEDKKVTPNKEVSKVTPSSKDTSNDKKQETPTNTAKEENHVLSSKLSGRDVTVSFDKNKIDADEIFVGAINDEKLNKEIIKKLGNEYKVVEVFEIYFKKDGKKLDSKGERTVRVSVVKSNSAELEVYHIAENNVLEKVEKSSFSNGIVEFKINHFSKFTILERIRVGAKDLESRVQIITPVKAEYNGENIQVTKNSTANNQSDKKGENIKKENEDLPKTGIKTTGTLSIALLSLGIAIIIRRKQKE